jgi:deoxycytidylate deaminase
VIVDKRGKIVAEAANDYQKTHPIMAKASKKLGMTKEYCHSEMLALVRAKGKGVKMYISRVDSKGNPCYSAPCPVCAALIAESQIKSVEYTT